MNTAAGLDALGRHLRALPPSCGPVRLVAVDGHAGAGKSTLAGRLATVLDGAPVVRLDDLASHDALFDWTGRFAAQVTGPLSRGKTACFGIYDWHRAAFTGEGEVAPRRVVLVDGVGAGRRALRPSLACLLWADVPRDQAWARGMRRDGPEQARFWRGWRQAESAHFRADPSRPFAQFLVRELEEGYEVLPGPARPACAPEGLTVGDVPDAPPGKARRRAQSGLDPGPVQELRSQ